MTAHDARAIKSLRARMDADVEQVLHRAKAVKAKLEALHRANAASRQLPSCGPGSSTDRTRSSVVSGLGNKLKDLMDGFQVTTFWISVDLTSRQICPKQSGSWGLTGSGWVQGLRTMMAEEYKETVARRYYTVTGEKADDGKVEALISSGESETFLQKAIEAQAAGLGQLLDTVSEIQERHDAVKEIERSLLDLHQVFLDMAALVEAQGHQLNDIESHVARANSFVRRGAVELETARDYQKSSRKWACYAVLAGAVLIAVLVLPILVNLHLLTIR
ncbi:hypothetical protein ABZP36_022402 [Zizania latifolia]